MKRTVLLSMVLMAVAAAHAGVTYVDAVSGTNTFLSDGSAMTGWDTRTVFGNGGAVYQANAGDDAPMLKTTVTGLTAGQAYNVYAYYWVAGVESMGDTTSTGNEQWDITTGLATDAMTGYLWNEGAQVDAGHFEGTVMVSEGNRWLFEAYAGTATADANGEIVVFIDDYTGNDDRTWYDGVGTAAVPEPATLALLGLGGLVLARRKR